MGYVELHALGIGLFFFKPDQFLKDGPREVQLLSLSCLRNAELSVVLLELKFDWPVRIRGLLLKLLHLLKLLYEALVLVICLKALVDLYPELSRKALGSLTYLSQTLPQLGHWKPLKLLRS